MEKEDWSVNPETSPSSLDLWSTKVWEKKALVQEKKKDQVNK